MSESVSSKDFEQHLQSVEDGEIVVLPTLDALLDEKNQQIEMLKQKMQSEQNEYNYRIFIENKLNAKQSEINEWVNRNSQYETDFEQVIEQHDRSLVFRMESQTNTLVSEKEKTRQFLKEVNYKERMIHSIKNNNTSEIQELDEELAGKDVEITSLKIEKLRQGKDQSEEIKELEELRKQQQEKRRTKRLRRAANKAAKK